VRSPEVEVIKSERMFWGVRCFYGHEKDERLSGLHFGIIISCHINKIAGYILFLKINKKLIKKSVMDSFKVRA